MIIYHGSTVLVEKPEIREGEYFLDFGIGFYTTTSYNQAERWARIKMRRENAGTGYVAIYEFDVEAAMKDTIVKRFESADMEWLMFDMDENIVQNVLGYHLESQEAKNIEQMMRRLGETALTLIRRENIEPQSPMAFHAYARAIKVMFRIGAAIELKRLGYKFEQVNLPNLGSGVEC